MFVIARSISETGKEEAAEEEEEEEEEATEEVAKEEAEKIRVPQKRKEQIENQIADLTRMINDLKSTISILDDKLAQTKKGSEEYQKSSRAKNTVSTLLKQHEKLLEKNQKALAKEIAFLTKLQSFKRQTGTTK